MSTPTVSEALDAWRAAERHWSATHPDDPTFRSASTDLVSAWLDYQLATGAFDPNCAVLVADDEQRYVAVVGKIGPILGYAPADLIGRRVVEVTAPAIAASAPAQWQRFLADGRQEGGYRILDEDGREVAIRYVATANHPIPGYHLSRIWSMATAPTGVEPELASAVRELAPT
jgi:PAS domain-containing protein